MNLLVPAIKHGLKKMILTSSMSVYGAQQAPFNEDMIPQPEDIYGITKVAMENATKVMANVYGFRYVIIRPHNVYGPRQNLSDPYRNVVGIFINRLLHSKNLYIYGDGKQKRAFSHVNDVIPAMLKAAFTSQCEGQILNIGSDHVSTLNELGQMVLEEFYGSRKIPSSSRPTYVSVRPQEVKYAYCNHSKAAQLIGFKPIADLRSGIRDMIAWAKPIGKQQFVYLASLDLEHPTTPKTWKAKLI